LQSQYGLTIANPEDGCSEELKSPPLSLQFVHSIPHLQMHSMILMKDSESCSWYSRVTRATVKGYTGVIAHSLTPEREALLKPTDWSFLEGYQMNVLIVSEENAKKLQTFSYPKQ